MKYYNFCNRQASTRVFIFSGLSSKIKNFYFLFIYTWKKRSSFYTPESNLSHFGMLIGFLSLKGFFFSSFRFSVVFYENIYFYFLLSYQTSWWWANFFSSSSFTMNKDIMLEREKKLLWVMVVTA